MISMVSPFGVRGSAFRFRARCGGKHPPCPPSGSRTLAALLAAVAAVAVLGCQGPAAYRSEADRTASDIIHEKQLETLGRTEPFSIERPSDTLRRRLLADQNLPYAGAAALGTDQLTEIEHWPEPKEPELNRNPSTERVLSGSDPIVLSLAQALQVAAKNNRDYQNQKEAVFRSALALDLERNAFRNTFFGQVEFLLESDRSGAETISGTRTSAAAGWERKLAGGAELSAALAFDLANLLTMGGASSLGQLADATVAIPLLRGSGQYIVQEPLTQAERNVVYAINDFERFKRAFAVDIAGGYLAVLRQMDETANAAQNYRSLIASARRARRLADAGRLPEIQVDQAVQNELRARDRWIAAIEQLENRLDAFKAVMGLPPDARVELDRKDLQRLSEKAQKTVAAMKTVPEGAGSAPPSDAPIDLPPPEEEGAGPMEMDPEGAIRLALENRLDLRSAIGAVFDSQRKVVVAADALRGELTLSGSATVGEGRSVDSADLEDAQLRFDKGQYGAFLTLDLPLERTAEQIAYRNSFIALEEAVRDVQELEDQIKISIQTSLRTLRTARESMSIQGRAVAVAQKRVRSINLFLEAGRAEVRDLLEAEESLFSAQNALTAALIDYRIAELRLQADMGLLALNEEGLWREYIPKGAEDDVR
ncbi:MAG: TolC family protein [Desulfobacteraceae bacterium]|nr:TolC family protein [Desulfobacteraceae bacterium]